MLEVHVISTSQSFVVSLGRRECIRAEDRFARIITAAIAPRRASRRIVADDFEEHRRDRAPLRLDRLRAVASEVARIGPRRAILVEVLRREEIHGERLDAGRRGAIPGGAHDHIGVARTCAAYQRNPQRADEGIALHVRSHALELRRWSATLHGLACRRVQRHGERRATAHALEAGICDFLRLAADGDQRDEKR